MASKNVLVIGANRGIGLNLVRGLVKRDWTVFGSVRPQTAADGSVNDLRETGAKVMQIDYLEESTITAAAREYGALPLDMLINCGAVGPGPDNWFDHTREIMLEKYLVDAVGPFLAVKHFYPALKKSTNAKIINLGSNSASMQRNSGEDLGYRMAKTALNVQTVTLTKEFEMAGDKITVLSIYPGYVATRLSNFRSKNNMEECIDGVLNVIENAKLEDSGRFVDWRGSTVPW